MYSLIGTTTLFSPLRIYGSKEVNDKEQYYAKRIIYFPSLANSATFVFLFLLCFLLLLSRFDTSRWVLYGK